MEFSSIGETFLDKKKTISRDEQQHLDINRDGIE